MCLMSSLAMGKSFREVAEHAATVRSL